MADELDVQTNFRSQQWEEAREALDAVFHRIFDILKGNPTLHALVDGRESEPQHKPGDFAVDYRDGNIRLKMSDGKNLLEISLAALGGSITADQHGALGFETSGGAQLHTNAVAGVSPGFMSAADKTKLNGLSNATPSNATPATLNASAGASGSSSDYSRADHVHQVAIGSPVTIGTANSNGTSANLARADHVHAHGNQAGGALHDAVIAGGAAGFMSGTDKTKLDRFDGYTSSGAAPSPSAGHFAIWHDSGADQLWIYSRGSGAAGVKRVQLI